ncbi:MAG: hypothetical protein R3A44_42545 [Caldilineaceae bacterium]
MHVNSSCLSILAEMQRLIQAGHYLEASALLAAQIESLLNECAIDVINDLLAEFPSALFHENRDLTYVEGFILARRGDLQAAITRLERARFSYSAAEPQLDRAVRCSLELARLYCSREHFQVAYHHLHTEVEPLITQGLVVDPALCARYFVRMTEITPDIGRLDETIAYARQALALYRQLNDVPGQLRALLRLTPTLNHQGAFDEVAATVTLAKECLANMDALPLDRARVLNPEIHAYWYRGQLDTALHLAEEYLALVDSVPTSNFRVYARMLLGNLHRERGEFPAAGSWYDEARRLIGELNYPLYSPWVDAQAAWLALLQGQSNQARAHIYAALQTADLGQTMSFQVALAVMHLQEGQFAVARRLLTESLAFYTQSGDELAICSLHFYLALIAHRQEQAESLYQHLDLALGWLARRHTDFAPFWRHPGLWSELCAQALRLGLYPEVVESVFLNHLGETGKAALQKLLYHTAPATAQHAYRLLHGLGDAVADLLVHLPDGAAKTVLATLLESGQLIPAAFLRLEQELMTATHRQKPNPTLLAVFGLYVNGASRAEIAEELACSASNVRNYITAIYEHFDLEAGEYSSRRVRWRSLVEKAREQGFVG